ncbi:hypothetical protein HPB50_007597 [Hyalomma asiaticum]|uniref:Uncharacterized protein n=1 Tax=Hyalomma asiaticum TaxID=266040 RepID=A0ACB7T6R5_HYAAI|nr:hypothetical protein HPB50_007597 [Hyalomma asiaticum]
MWQARSPSTRLPDCREQLPKAAPAPRAECRERLPKAAPAAPRFATRRLLPRGPFGLIESRDLQKEQYNARIVQIEQENAMLKGAIEQIMAEMAEMRSADKREASQPPQPASAETPMVVHRGALNAPYRACAYSRRTRKVNNLSQAVANHDLTLVTDPAFPTRIGNSCSRDTTPDLTLRTTTLVEKRRPQLSDAQRASIRVSPFPRNVHPHYNVGRRRARAVALLRHVRNEPHSVCFVDAARYGHSARFVAIVIDHKGLILNSASLKDPTPSKAEQAAIALALSDDSKS